jgi:hypothetical protein
LDQKKISRGSARVKRLTLVALASCDTRPVANINLANINIRRATWVQVHIPSSSTSKPAAARRALFSEWYPLPPPENSGGVKFTTVVLSLAYDNFGVATAPA